MDIRVAVVFDFDDTLGPDSTSGYLEHMGVDVKEFWGTRVNPLLETGWDPVVAYLREMVRESNSRPAPHRFTAGSMAEWGKSVPLYPGVRRLFRELRDVARESYEHATVEFFLVSSGLLPILDHSPIRGEFSDAWACDFDFDEDGAIAFPKNVVSFTDKTRYLFQIHKGQFGQGSRRLPFLVNKKLARDQFHVPMRQMVFVGDGYTDIPCFSLLLKNDGIAIGVFDNQDREKMGRAWGFIEDGRVSNMLPADYTKSGPVRSILGMTVQGIISSALIRAKTYEG